MCVSAVVSVQRRRRGVCLCVFLSIGIDTSINEFQKPLEILKCDFMDKRRA